MKQKIQNEIEKLNIGFIDSITAENLTSLGIDGAEIILDSVLETGILKDIPIFGIIYKSAKTLKNIENIFFMKKIYNFLFEIKSISTEKRKEFILELEESIGYNQKAGETLITLLARLDHVSKPSILGKLMKAKMEENISIEIFLRLSYIIEKAFIYDLNNINRIIQNNNRNVIALENLATLNLLRKSLLSSGAYSYELTSLGEILIEFGGVE